MQVEGLDTVGDALSPLSIAGGGDGCNSSSSEKTDQRTISQERKLRGWCSGPGQLCGSRVWGCGTLGSTSQRVCTPRLSKGQCSLGGGRMGHALCSAALLPACGHARLPGPQGVQEGLHRLLPQLPGQALGERPLLGPPPPIPNPLGSHPAPPNLHPAEDSVKGGLARPVGDLVPAWLSIRCSSRSEEAHV